MLEALRLRSGRFRGTFTLFASLARSFAILHRCPLSLPFNHDFYDHHDHDHDMNRLFFVGGAEIMNCNSRPAERQAAQGSADEAHEDPNKGHNKTPPASPITSHRHTQSSHYRHSSPKPLPLHSRSGSVAEPGATRTNNRLSLHFPVQPSTAISSSRSTPYASPALTNTPITSPELDPSPTATTFLTALAAQERRVLELKEELHKAEQQLTKLKKQWATHEAARKRNDARRLQPLQPVSTSMASLEATEDDIDGSSLWLQKEMERRKALLNGVRSSQRTVFSGSRHTRTLSLLSPEKGVFRPSFPQPDDVRQATEPTKSASHDQSSTKPDAGRILGMDGANDVEVTPRDALLRTGKQMASDFKDGLWTFIEDIRQATVGDEGIHGPRRPSTQSNTGPKPAKRQPNKGMGKASIMTGQETANNPAKRTSAAHSSTGDQTALIDIGGTFWKENGLFESANATPAKGLKTRKMLGTPLKPPLSPRTQDGDDAWDAWESPNARSPARPSIDETLPYSSPSSEGPGSILSGESSARTSTSSEPAPYPATLSFTADLTDTTSTPAEPEIKSSDPIPWPALSKISPTNLTRTASHLMSEWEKSLSPPSSDSTNAESRKDVVTSSLVRSTRSGNIGKGEYVARKRSPSSAATHT